MQRPVFVVVLLLFLPLISEPVVYGQVMPVRYELPNRPSLSIDGVSSDSASESKSSDDPPLHESKMEVGPAAPTAEKIAFSRWKIAAVANTLGAGFEVSTPLARHFDLRGGANFLSVGYEIDVDGLHYDSDIRMRSGNLRLDWFPRRRNFHISPGLLYANNNVKAITHVPAGAHFELGDEAFTNSINDPVHGDARLNFPRRASPMITLGFQNVLPGRHDHISVPIEFGVAYTGSAKIDVSLTGTACQTDGCFSFADNAEAQQSLKNEVRDINNTLGDVPIYPILSIGFAYRF